MVHIASRDDAGGGSGQSGVPRATNARDEINIERDDALVQLDALEVLLQAGLVVGHGRLRALGERARERIQLLHRRVAYALAPVAHVARHLLAERLARHFTLLFRVSAGFLGARLDVPERVYVHARWPMDAPGDRRGMHGRAVRDRSMSEVVAWTNDSLSTRLPASEN